MYIPVVFLCLLLRLVLAQNDTLQDVTIEWKLSPGLEAMTTHVESSNNLIENLPNLYVVVKGVVPIINAGVFRDMEKLRFLTISDIGLKEIQAETFQNLPQLEYIGCNNNNLSEIKSGTFVNLNVTWLELKSDRIKILEKGAFQNLPHLNELHLEDNQLEEIKSGVFSDILLFRLDLSDNLISKLEAGVFHFSDNDYYELSIILNKNKLKEIDPEAFSNKRVDVLELNENAISQLRSGDLKNMPQLKTLYISKNLLKTIPDDAFPPTLETLDLSNNQIAHISSQAFHGIQYLKLLILTHNQLTKWDPEWFDGSVTRYTSLFFSYNNIEEIPDDAFKNIPEIEKLDLGKNRIRRISIDAFKGLRKVQSLWLNDNDIEEWDERTLGGNLAITEINLRRNRIQCFRGDLKNIFKNVGVAWVEQNPISKECSKKVDEYNKGIKLERYRFTDGSW